jgi:hypothetical protein
LNSLDIDNCDGNLIVSVKNFNQILKVARSETVFNGKTYSTGEVIWRLGGPNSDFTILNDNRENGFVGFAGQHSARMLPDNNIIIFDNSFLPTAAPTGSARYIEYELDFDNMTAKLVAEFESNPLILNDEASSIGNSSPVCGSVQKLYNGNVVIGWGGQAAYGNFPTATLTEIDPNLNKVFELAMEEGEMSYRAFKFSKNEDGSWNYGSLLD